MLREEYYLGTTTRTRRRPIVAWRLWKLTPDGRTLRSIVQGGRGNGGLLWRPGRPVKARRVARIWGPGVYALRSRRLALQWRSEKQSPSDYVASTVRLTGTIHKYRGGYKAEVAEVAGLTDRDLAERYGVPYIRIRSPRWPFLR